MAKKKKAELLETHLEKFSNPLGTKVLNALYKGADIETLGDLILHNPKNLLRFTNFGKTGLRKVTDFVKANGFKLAADD